MSPVSLQLLLTSAVLLNSPSHMHQPHQPALPPCTPPTQKRRHPLAPTLTAFAQDLTWETIALAYICPPPLIPIVLLPTTSYDSLFHCSFPALDPNGTPTLPIAPCYHFAPRTLEYGTGRQNISSTWGKVNGWELSFFLFFCLDPGTHGACFQLLSRLRRGRGLCVIWECN